jgi:hypothetical protein
MTQSHVSGHTSQHWKSQSDFMFYGKTNFQIITPIRGTSI